MKKKLLFLAAIFSILLLCVLLIANQFFTYKVLGGVYETPVNRAPHICRGFSITLYDYRSNDGDAKFLCLGLIGVNDK